MAMATPFLQGEDVLELRVIRENVHEGQFCGARIPNDVLYACSPQDLQKGLPPSHERHMQVSFM